MMIYFYALISTLLEIYGDYLFKVNRPALGIASYLIGIAPWFIILKDSDLSSAIVIFTSLNVVGCVLIGRMVLHETISTQQYCGIGFCLLGVLLMYRLPV
jgi:multidrug transporter EmrE-like cation transporter